MTASRTSGTWRVLSGQLFSTRSAACRQLDAQRLGTSTCTSAKLGLKISCSSTIPCRVGSRESVWQARFLLECGLVNGRQRTPGEAEAGGIVCNPASWAMACHCSARDTPCYRGCDGVGRGQAQPLHEMAHHSELLAHQPASALPGCSRHVRFCQGSQRVLQTPVPDLLPLRTTSVATRSS